jgi:hypothetical protein
MHAGLRSSFRLFTLVLALALLGGTACLFPWLTVLVFIRTSHSSEIGHDGASFWHSGLPLRFLTRSDISMNWGIDSFAYWSDVVFWFFVILALVAAIRYRFHHARSLPVA